MVEQALFTRSPAGKSAGHTVGAIWLRDPHYLDWLARHTHGADGEPLDAARRGAARTLLELAPTPDLSGRELDDELLCRAALRRRTDA